MAHDKRQLAQACQILLGLAGIEGESLWNRRGPNRRASWLKGYLRRPARAEPAAGTGRGRGPVSPIDSFSHGERTMLLVAFDFWNHSGGVLFSDVLALSPRLVVATAGLMEAWCLQSGDAIAAWIARWEPAPGPGPG